MNDKKEMRMTAAMEGQAVVVREIGNKVEVSEMELIVLCNFAELGVMSVFSQLCGAEGASARRDYRRIMLAIRREFAAKGNADGLNRLSTSAAAILRSERFQKYLVPSTPNTKG